MINSIGSAKEPADVLFVVAVGETDKGEEVAELIAGCLAIDTRRWVLRGLSERGAPGRTGRAEDSKEKQKHPHALGFCQVCLS